MRYSDFLNMAKRHAGRLIAILISFVGLAVLVAFTMAPVYRSDSTILIDVADVKDLPTTVGGYIDAQLENVERAAQSDDSLWAIIEELDLYKVLREEKDKKAVIGQMREHIEREITSFETVNPHQVKGSSAGTFLFTLAYEGETAEAARDVTKRLAERYVEENAISRTAKAKDVALFLGEVVANLKLEVDDLADRITVFRKANVNSLPEQEQANRGFLEKAEYDLALIRANVIGWSSQKRQIESRRAIANSGQLSVNESVRELKVKLNEARARYSDLHPDVLKIKAEIKAMARQVKAGQGAQIVQTETTAQRSSEKVASITRRAALAEVSQKLRGAEVSEKQLRGKIAEYERRLVNAPSIGIEYTKLNREIDEANKSYQQMKSKLMEAKLAERVESESKGERYIIHKAAYMPTAPSSPNIPLLIVLGLVLGLGICVAYVALVSMFDKRVYGTAGVISLFDAPPLAVIPVIK